MHEPAMSLLVLGGARSGKSGYAQGLCEASGLSPIFVATADVRDEEMAARVALHVAARGPAWRVEDVRTDLAERLPALARPRHVVLVDCLTLWLTNLVLRGDDVAAATAALVAALPRCTGPVVFVSNEVGQGIVPGTPLGRAFRDDQGRLNQAMARACAAVVEVVAGLPRTLKPAPDPAIRLGSP